MALPRTDVFIKCSTLRYAKFILLVLIDSEKALIVTEIYILGNAAPIIDKPIYRLLIENVWRLAIASKLF